MFIKVALDGGLSEGFIICARTILGAAVLLPMAIRAGAVPPILGRARAGRWPSPSAQVIVPFGLITFGENHVPSALAGILVATSPLFIALLAIEGRPRRALARAGAWSASCSGWSASCCCSASTSAATPRRSSAA